MNRKKLNRKFTVLLQSIPADQKNEILKNIYNKGIANGLDKIAKYSVTHPNYSVDSLQCEAYEKIGKRLIDFAGITNGTRYFSELEQKMFNLGQNVSFLMTKFNDAGLSRTENLWLGISQVSQDCSQFFSPSIKLRNLEPIQDCSSKELVLLFNNYQAGKINVYESNFEYGHAFNGNYK
ncbi:hypothetical protein HOK51_00550 [Candidatus Woesearchaeota archaeon]|jgi:hypothetical protein|nr:hypothetical protein [Candidatus Woesearchaeota archaeon]MBT6518303.1 hypothetical protein [Candidatus Woesearchaeota archaeon]MBT7367086.1 hypothetical protein [Candidatus Woesearchaeota archaeon]